MHAKTSEENIHATQYLQGKPIVVSDVDVLLRFPSLPLPPCSKTPSMPHSSKSAPRKLYMSKSVRKREYRESSKIELTKFCELVLIILFINEAFIFFIFHYFRSISSSHVTYDISPPFSPNFHYFHK